MFALCWFFSNLEKCSSVTASLQSFPDDRRSKKLCFGDMLTLSGFSFLSIFGNFMLSYCVCFLVQI